MTYNVAYSNSTKTAISINEVTATSGKVEDKSTSLVFYGKNTADYGEGLWTNLLHLLENFSNNSEPPKPVEGQIWYDSGTNKSLYIAKVKTNATIIKSPDTVASTNNTGLYWAKIVDMENLASVQASVTGQVTTDIIAKLTSTDANDTVANNLKAAIVTAMGKSFVKLDGTNTPMASGSTLKLAEYADTTKVADQSAVYFKFLKEYIASAIADYIPEGYGSTGFGGVAPTGTKEVPAFINAAAAAAVAAATAIANGADEATAIDAGVAGGVATSNNISVADAVSSGLTGADLGFGNGSFGSTNFG
jgi:hypothetical protein